MNLRFTFIAVSSGSFSKFHFSVFTANLSETMKKTLTHRRHTISVNKNPVERPVSELSVAKSKPIKGMAPCKTQRRILSYSTRY